MPREKPERIPQRFKQLDEAADFWDSHDLGDYWAQTRRAIFDVQITSERNYVAVENSLAEKLAELARARGVSVETLLNLWIREKVSQVE